MILYILFGKTKTKRKPTKKPQTNWKAETCCMCVSSLCCVPLLMSISLLLSSDIVNRDVPISIVRLAVCFIFKFLIPNPSPI